MIRIFGLAVITTLLASGTRSMSAEEPLRSGCKDGASRQFDFWVGHWRVTEHGKLAGDNRVEPILDGCALLENWTGAKGGAGKSLNFFDREDGLWHQTWIDRSGGALFLAGKFENGAMRPWRVSARPPANNPRRATASPGRRYLAARCGNCGSRRPWVKTMWSTQFDGLYEPSRD